MAPMAQVVKKELWVLPEQEEPMQPNSQKVGMLLSLLIYLATVKL